MDREKILEGLTRNMVIRAIKKPMPLFLILLAAAYVPEQEKYVTRLTMQDLIIKKFKVNTKKIQEVIFPQKITNVVRADYLERHKTHLMDEKEGFTQKEIYGHSINAQGVYRITPKGLKRLKRYIEDFKDKEIPISLEGIDQKIERIEKFLRLLKQSHKRAA